MNLMFVAFVNEGALIPPPDPGPKGNRSSRILVIAGIVASVVMLLTLGTWYYLHNRNALNDFEDIGKYMSTYSYAFLFINKIM